VAGFEVITEDLSAVLVETPMPSLSNFDLHDP